jgi:hypothetical protein
MTATDNATTLRICPPREGPAGANAFDDTPGPGPWTDVDVRVRGRCTVLSGLLVLARQTSRPAHVLHAGVQRQATPTRPRIRRLRAGDAGRLNASATPEEASPSHAAGALGHLLRVRGAATPAARLGQGARKQASGRRTPHDRVRTRVGCLASQRTVTTGLPGVPRGRDPGRQELGLRRPRWRGARPPVAGRSCVFKISLRTCLRVP